jgi:hypothetical protein
MATLTLETLAQRVTALEQEMAQWRQAHPQPSPPWKDWRQAVGHFTPSELSEEVDAAGRAIREADRQQTEP